jgi:hypothetical protein
MALSLQSDFKQGPLSFQFGPFFSQIFAARVSSDNPRLKAFCRVAPQRSGLFLLLAFFGPQASSTHGRLLLSTLAFSSVLTAAYSTIVKAP